MRQYLFCTPDQLNAWVQSKSEDESIIKGDIVRALHPWRDTHVRLLRGRAIELADVVATAFINNDHEHWLKLQRFRATNNISLINRKDLANFGTPFFLRDLGAALSAHDGDAAQSIAKATLSEIPAFGRPSPDVDVLEILASFVDGDVRQARRVAMSLKEQCESRLFGRDISQRYVFWAEAALSLCDRDLSLQTSSLQRLTKHDEHDLGRRFKRARNSEDASVSLRDFFDDETSCLVSIMLSVGFDCTAASPFFDVDWLR